MLTAMEVARYIINRYSEKGKPVSNMKLQKLLYLAQIYFLERTGKKLFEDDIKAWKFGPIVIDVYQGYCMFGANSIYRTYDGAKEIVENELGKYKEHKLNEVLDENCKLESWELVRKVQEPGKAWDLTYRQGKGAYFTISEDNMKEFGSDLQRK